MRLWRGWLAGSHPVIAATEVAGVAVRLQCLAVLGPGHPVAGGTAVVEAPVAAIGPGGVTAPPTGRSRTDDGTRSRAVVWHGHASRSPSGLPRQNINVPQELPEDAQRHPAACPDDPDLMAPPNRKNPVPQRAESMLIDPLLRSQYESIVLHAATPVPFIQPRNPGVVQPEHDLGAKASWQQMLLGVELDRPGAEAIRYHQGFVVLA